MTVKPYSFRYPYSIDTTLRPWRGSLGSNYEQVVHILHDRDRALEDHLSLDVAQGILALGFQPTGTLALAAGGTDITGTTVTVTVPNGRMLQITAHIRVIAASATPTSTMDILDQVPTTLTSDYFFHGSTGGVAAAYAYNVIAFYAPAAGTYTFKAKGFSTAGSTSAEAIGGPGTTSSNFLVVEDIGPAARF